MLRDDRRSLRSGRLLPDVVILGSLGFGFVLCDFVFLISFRIWLVLILCVRFYWYVFNVLFSYVLFGLMPFRFEGLNLADMFLRHEVVKHPEHISLMEMQ